MKNSCAANLYYDYAYFYFYEVKAFFAATNASPLSV